MRREKKPLLRAGCLAIAFGLVLTLSEAQAGTEIYNGAEREPPASLKETPLFEAQVKAGELPPVAERVPQMPAVMVETDYRSIGKHGGELKSLIGTVKDTKLFGVYGYARLVGYNAEFELEADILRALEVEDGRIFTFKLRPGHRWSDGHPFTTEDFRYFWEDVALNEELFPSGPPKLLLVDGEKPKVEIIDETTIRYSWSKPNPFLIPAIAGASPFFLYRPSHFLKQFHGAHADAAKLDALVQEKGMRSWAQLHNKIGNLYRFQNPDLPTLQPWRLLNGPPARRFKAQRNPFYHRVDDAGNQLPYVDRVILRLTSSALIPAKTGSGESDLQARGLHFRDTPFLKEGEGRGDFTINLWQTARGSQFALYPNMNVTDPVWRGLMRDVRFRRALSLATDRTEINQIIYFGTGLEGNNTILPGSPLYDEDYRSRWATFDIDKANALLDEMGLTERSDRGIRLMSDGRPIEIIVETAGEDTEESDVLELITDSWKRIGVGLFIKPSQREFLRTRIFSGETLMAISFGLENGVPNALMSPQEFVPVQQHSYQWPMWGQYFETSGNSGEPVDMPLAEELMALYRKWKDAKTADEKGTIWQRILEINADQVYTIGLVAGVPQPVVRSNKLHNLPQEAVYNWNPGAHFGAYRTDCIWIEQ